MALCVIFGALLFAGRVSFAAAFLCCCSFITTFKITVAFEKPR